MRRGLAPESVGIQEPRQVRILRLSGNLVGALAALLHRLDSFESLRFFRNVGWLHRVSPFSIGAYCGRPDRTLAVAAPMSRHRLPEGADETPSLLPVVAGVARATRAVVDREPDHARLHRRAVAPARAIRAAGAWARVPSRSKNRAPRVRLPRSACSAAFAHGERSRAGSRDATRRGLCLLQVLAAEAHLLPANEGLRPERESGPESARRPAAFLTRERRDVCGPLTRRALSVHGVGGSGPAVEQKACARHYGRRNLTSRRSGSGYTFDLWGSTGRLFRVRSTRSMVARTSLALMGLVR